MRAAGCTINDIFNDRNIDPHVTRTKDRPLASKAMSTKQALYLLFILHVFALLLAVQLPYQAYLYTYRFVLIYHISIMQTVYSMPPTYFRSSICLVHTYHCRNLQQHGKPQCLATVRTNDYMDYNL